MVILLGSVPEGKKHVPPDWALESGRFSGQSGLRVRPSGKPPVAFAQLGHGRLSHFFDVWRLIAGGSVAQRPFGTAPLIGVKDPYRISLNTPRGRGRESCPRFRFCF